MNLQQALQQGLTHQAKRNFPAAESVFRSILTEAPRTPDAWNALGLLLRETGRLGEATEALRKAVASAPSWAPFHNNLAVALQDQGSSAEAEACCAQALRLKPGYPSALFNRGRALKSLGRLPEAIACFQETLRIQPNFLAALTELAIAHDLQGAEEDAEKTYRQAVTRDPAQAKHHLNLAGFLLAKGRPAEALETLTRAMAYIPDSPDIFMNLGAARVALGRLEEARTSFAKCLDLDPTFSAAWVSYGNLLVRLGCFDDANQAYQRALALDPKDPLAHLGNAMCLDEAGAFGEAEQAYARAIEGAPDLADAHVNLAFTLLTQGKWQEGFREMEWRLRKPAWAGQPSLDAPSWDGAPLRGRRILLYSEQGLGDTLHFIRYAKNVKEKGGETILACQAPLQRLLARAPGVDQVLEPGVPWPPVDVQCSLLSLPYLLGTCQGRLPDEGPYLVADPDRVHAWRRELAGLTGIRVGICWQGNPDYVRDRIRSIPCSAFLGLADMPAVNLVSIQVGPARAALEGFSGKVLDLGDRLTDFSETAAVMANLDLIISSDTSPVHLAGALGRPTWVALNHTPDWRWQRERADSPWYPTLRLFRQKEPGQWDPVFSEIREALAQFQAKA